MERWSSSVLLLLKFLAFVPQGSLLRHMLLCFKASSMPDKISRVSLELAAIVAKA